MGNKFNKNDISAFTPSTAHVLFLSHAHDNVFQGPSGIVVDLGEDNVFTD
jgi:hypothetical protein